MSYILSQLRNFNTPFQFSRVSNLYISDQQKEQKVVFENSCSDCIQPELLWGLRRWESQQGIYFEEKVISAHLVIVCPNTHHIHESNLSQMLYFSNKDILNNLETNHIQNVLIIIISYNGSTLSLVSLEISL